MLFVAKIDGIEVIKLYIEVEVEMKTCMIYNVNVQLLTFLQEGVVG